MKYVFFPISSFSRLPFPEPDYSEFLNKTVNPVKSKGSLFRQNNVIEEFNLLLLKFGMYILSIYSGI